MKFLEKIKIFFKNFWTTIAGSGVLLTLLIQLLDNNPTNDPAISLIITEVLIAFGLIASKDADKTSEDIGLKKEIDGVSK